MADYLFRGDPNLPEALYQRNWLSFLKALETTTPELIRSLDAACFKAFTILAGEYAKLSPYQFGALTCEWDGRPALTAFPLGDLANLICRPNSEKPSNPWPPSAFYWDSVLRAPLLELREAMREWSQNFMATEGILHSRLVDAGLETMSAWLQEPQLPHVAPWYGIGECIPRQCFNRVQVQITLPGWDPTTETEKDFQNRTRELRSEIDRWARDQIVQLKPLVMKFDPKRNPEHFDWTALRLVRAMTYPSIADYWTDLNPRESSSILDEGTARKGVRTTLKALGLRDVAANRK